jgi:hypothetical protein
VSKRFAKGAPATIEASRRGVEARKRLREERAQIEAGLADDPRAILAAYDRHQAEIDRLEEAKRRLLAKMARVGSHDAQRVLQPPATIVTDKHLAPANGNAAPPEPPHYDPLETERRLADVLAKSHGAPGTNGHGAASAPAPEPANANGSGDGRIRGRTPDGRIVVIEPDAADKLIEQNAAKFGPSR